MASPAAGPPWSFCLSTPPHPPATAGCLHPSPCSPPLPRQPPLAPCLRCSRAARSSFHHHDSLKSHTRSRGFPAQVLPGFPMAQQTGPAFLPFESSASVRYLFPWVAGLATLLLSLARLNLLFSLPQSPFHLSSPGGPRLTCRALCRISILGCFSQLSWVGSLTVGP